MCIHFFQAQYTCGCTRELPRVGANHQGPVLCLSVKTAYDKYHAQPYYPPQEQPIPPPKPCPPISHTGAARTPGNIALVQAKGLCFVHWHLLRLCQMSEEQRVASYLHAHDSGHNTAAMSYPLTAWREIAGDQGSTGKYLGEDGSFRGVECYTVDPVESLFKGDVKSILTVRSGAQMYSVGSIVSPEQRENYPASSSKVARNTRPRHKSAQRRKQNRLKLKQHRQPSLQHSETCDSARLATDDDHDVDGGTATPTPVSLLSPSGLVAETVGNDHNVAGGGRGKDDGGKMGEDTLELLLDDTLLHHLLAKGRVGHRRTASF